jgi:hypothetical protein
MRAEPRFKPLPPEPATLLTEGRRAEAVKVLRKSQGIGLGQAKRWIDWHVAQDPMLGVQLEVQRLAARRRFFVWFLLIDVLVAAGIIYYLLYVRGST